MKRGSHGTRGNQHSKRVYDNDGSTGAYNSGALPGGGGGFRSPTFRSKAGGIPSRIGGGTIAKPGRLMGKRGRV